MVTATGLYLYIFFDTGIKAAYESVEQITHGQWYLGQVVRGLHRYGSDAMVLAMGLHMLRHFLFDHYRSFRWFSWDSGVAVLWLVFASGINGFMLPWDRLAQDVTLASAELVDWLPIVAEPMARNFLHEGSVSDRLFTLLMFMHIGIPLFSLLVLWIHTQRVPRAETAPPRALALPLLAALVLLALVKPVPAPLDSERALTVIRILEQMARQYETAVIVVTHDEKIIPTFRRIYHIRDGRTHEEAGEGRVLQ